MTKRASSRTAASHRGTTATTEPVIEVRGLQRSYGTVQAVDGINLSISQGEIFALLGPNGAGKTTTVEILEGFRKRTGGVARVLDTDPANATRLWRSRIGIVPQDSHDAPDLTVLEVVSHYAKFYPNPLDPAELIEHVGLGRKATTRIMQLSGGQRRRVDVALGIVGRPEILFLDEPTTGFDPKARRDFWELIESLRDAGTTVVLTTHYLDEAEHLADRVAIIAEGALVAEGSPDELRRRSGSGAVVSWTDIAAPGGPATVSVRTQTPTATVAGLIDNLASDSLEIPGLLVSRPTLEDYYLELVRAPDTTPQATDAGKEDSKNTANTAENKANEVTS